MKSEFNSHSDYWNRHTVLDVYLSREEADELTALWQTHRRPKQSRSDFVRRILTDYIAAHKTDDTDQNGQ